VANECYRLKFCHTIKDHASLYGVIFAQFMTLQKNQILARAVRIQGDIFQR